MRLIYQAPLYIALPDARGEDERARAAGFFWSRVRRQWSTESAIVASRLIDCAQDGLIARLEPIARAFAASGSTDTALEIPAPPGASFLPFQKAGIAALLQRKRALLADEMGLGKTVQALGLINADPSIKRVLVICPASVKLNWAREARRWLSRPFNVAVLMPRDAGLSYVRDGDFLIVNYDILDRFTVLPVAQLDLLAVDEAHALKNPNTKRSRLVREIHATREVFLTGTPIPNRVAELWPLADRLAGWSSHDPHAHSRFKDKFCRWDNIKWDELSPNARWNAERRRDMALDQLQHALRSTIMIRRLKANVLPDLPPKFRQVIELDPGSARSIVRNEVQFYDNWQAMLEQARADVAALKDKNEDDYKSAIKRLNDTVAAGWAELGKLRHMTALAKLPHVIKRLKELVFDEGQKIVCFAHHLDVIDKIAREFNGSVVTITGATSQADRQINVDRFQSQASVKLFVGGIHAAGEGITLTAARTAVFAELDWVPAKLTQAEDRLHRIGAKESVLIMHLVFDESLDARMAKVAISKQELADRSLNSK